jgi:hypothetical protein
MAAKLVTKKLNGSPLTAAEGAGCLGLLLLHALQASTAIAIGQRVVIGV